LNNVCPALTPTERGVVKPLMLYAMPLGQRGRNGREYAGLIGILLADRSRGGERGAIAGERLRHAFVILPDDGALSVELRITLISARQRRLDGLCGVLAR
jgi:hypothetical protein